jgi:hypothetical protein
MGTRHKIPVETLNLGKVLEAKALRIKKAVDLRAKKLADLSKAKVTTATPYIGYSFNYRSPY